MYKLQKNQPYFRAPWQIEGVQTLITTRYGGVSTGSFSSLNIASHVGDNPDHVAQNRSQLARWISVPIIYLNQVHGTHVVEINQFSSQNIAADASINRDGTVACAVMTADCLPILLYDPRQQVVAAVHGGWRGLCAGIIEKTITQMSDNTEEIIAYLGPAISMQAFEVGTDVYHSFIQGSLKEYTSSYFHNVGDRYLADLYGIATQLLHNLGVKRISGGSFCTFTQSDYFFSYRRRNQTGRMLSAIWLTNTSPLIKK